MKAIRYLIIIFLAPTIILLNFRLLVFNYHYYQKEFAKLGVYNRFEKNVADAQSKKLIDYLCCQNGIDSEFFTQREILHLKDVKGLIRLANIQLFINLSLVILVSSLLILGKKKELLSSALKFGSIIGIISIIALTAIATINFNILFTNFHLISFRNNLWLLPEDANLIKLFPQEFFRDFANRVVLQSMAMLAIIFLVSSLVNKSK